MATRENLIKTTATGITAREIDLTSQFATDLSTLMNLLGIAKPITKEAGTKLVMKKVSVDLENSVAEGEVIPFSEVAFDEVHPQDITIEKYAVSATLEAVQKWGYDVAVDKADQGLLASIRSKKTKDFYGVIADGTLEANATGLQKKISKAIAKISTHFEAISLGVTGVAAFVNTEEFYDYLGDASITVQTAFGMNYIKNFLGCDVIFLTSQVEYGTVIATPLNNLFLFTVDPASSDFAKAGLIYTTDETGFIGIHIVGEYGTATSETYAVCGVTLWAEYIDGIAVVTETP